MRMVNFVIIILRRTLSISQV